MEIYATKFKALGTEIKIFLRIGEKNGEKIQKAISRIKRIYRSEENILSRFDQNSELSKLNSSLDSFCFASPDLLYLAQKSLEYYELSEHFFDPRILTVLEDIGYRSDFGAEKFSKLKISGDIKPISEPLKNDIIIKNNQMKLRKRMDFSGIAKGYVTDIAAKYLANSGWENFLIDSGGDIFARGFNEKNEPWLIGLEGASKKLNLKLSNMAAATSGITRRKWEIKGARYHHLINPKNPYQFSFSFKSATVIAKSCEEADVFAKILYIMGKERGLEFSLKNKIAGLFLSYSGNVYLTPEIKKYIVQ